jgi:hypothetical protein
MRARSMPQGPWRSSRAVMTGDDVNAVAAAEAGAIPPLVDLLRGEGSTEGAEFIAMALFNLTSLDAGRRQIEGLGYTRNLRRELLAERPLGSPSLAERNPGHKRKRESDSCRTRRITDRDCFLGPVHNLRCEAGAGRRLCGRRHQSESSLWTACCTERMANFPQLPSALIEDQSTS